MRLKQRIAMTARQGGRPIAGSVSSWMVVLLLLSVRPTHQLLAAELSLLEVQPVVMSGTVNYDGQVEASRHADLAVQVTGSVRELNVHVGDAVHAGQVLLRVDTRTAEQNAAASDASVGTAQATLDVARRELARKRQLAKKHYISQAALEQAESQYRAARAQVQALSAQADAARTQSSLHVVQAPFDGLVARVTVELGDMATPGRPLITIYDPKALRVSAHVPTSMLSKDVAGAHVWLSKAGNRLEPEQVRIMPTVDASSLTQEVRADLPAGTVATPGQFARLQLSAVAERTLPRLLIPAAAVVRRAEVTAVYVATEGGTPQLRQLRLGPVVGDQVEVLAGLDAGERIVTDPQVAARALAQAQGRGGKR